MRKKATNKPRMLDLKQITLDPRLRTRAELDQGHIESMAEVIKAGERLRGDPPVVFNNGRTNWLADSFHRHAAHLLAGEKKMECEVRHGEFSDAEEYAMTEANRGHGLKLDEYAVRRKIEWALKHPKWKFFSDHHVANLLHANQRYVTEEREQMSGTTHLLDPA